MANLTAFKNNWRGELFRLDVTINANILVNTLERASYGGLEYVLSLFCVIEQVFIVVNDSRQRKACLSKCVKGTGIQLQLA